MTVTPLISALMLTVSTAPQGAALHLSNPRTILSDSSAGAGQSAQQTGQRQANPQAETDEIQFTGPDGKPLPPAVEAELRRQIKAQQALPLNHNPKSGATSGDIIVSGIRSRGAVKGNVMPERVFDASDLQARGANDVGELLKSLAPQGLGIRSSGGMALLINGERTSSFSEIAAYPAEAIERVEILPESVALSYGFPGNQKVINVITFERYQSTSLDMKTAQPTGGGRFQLTGQPRYFQIDRKNRISLLLDFQAADALTYGNLGYPEAADRSILPRLREITVQPAFHGVTDGLQYGALARLNDARSISDLGSTPLGISRLAVDTRSLDTSINLDGTIGTMSVISVSDLRIENENSSITPKDFSMGASSGRYRSTTASTTLISNGAIANLPEGKLFGTLQFRLLSEASNAGPSQIATTSRFDRRTLSFQGGLSAPLVGQSSNCAQAFGCLVANASIRQDFTTAEPGFAQYEIGIDWSSASGLRAIVSYSHDRALPPMRLLVQPQISSTGLIVVDGQTGASRPVTYLSGGNPYLVPSISGRFSAHMTFRPIPQQDLILDANFERTRTTDPFFNILSTVPLIEEAYPENFVRNASGQLTTISSSPVNARARKTADLGFGITFSRSFGGASGQTITTSVPAGGNVASALPPGAIVIMADDNDAAGGVFDDNESRVFASLRYTAHLQDSFVLPNGAYLDAIKDGQPDDYFSRSAYSALAQAGVYRKGIGTSLQGALDGPRRLRLAESSAIFTKNFDRVPTSMIVDLNVFCNLYDIFKKRFLINARLTFAADNIFDVTLGNRGSEQRSSADAIPLFLKPLGRIISLKFHKSW